MPVLKTDTQVRSAKVVEGQIRTDYGIEGTRGLQLRVSAAGTKMWRFKSRSLGVVNIGPFPQISLHEARIAAAQLVAEAAKQRLNRDMGRPILQVRDRRTVNDILRDYGIARGAVVRSWNEQKRAIEMHYAWILRKTARSVSRSELLRPVLEERNVASKRACIYLGAALRWAGVGDEVPARRELDDAVPEEPRRRVLSDPELRAVLAADVTEHFKDILWTLLLTAQRRGDVAAMRIEDIDEHGVWRFRTEKSRTSELVAHPLSESVLRIVDRRRRGRAKGYVFARDWKERPFTSWSYMQGSIQAASGTRDWTLHDLRRTSRTMLARLGIPMETAERVLNHSLPRLVKVYDQHDHLSALADAYDRLEAALLGIRDGGVVVLDSVRTRRRDLGA